MAGQHGSAENLQRLPERFVGQMGRVEDHADAFHLTQQRGSFLLEAAIAARAVTIKIGAVVGRTEGAQPCGKPLGDVARRKNRPAPFHAQNETDGRLIRIFPPLGNMVLQAFAVRQLPQMPAGNHRSVIGQLAAARREGRLPRLVEGERLVPPVESRQKGGDDRADAASPQLGPRDGICPGERFVKVFLELPNLADRQEKVAVPFARVPGHVEVCVEDHHPPAFSAIELNKGRPSQSGPSDQEQKSAERRHHAPPRLAGHSEYIQTAGKQHDSQQKRPAGEIEQTRAASAHR